MKIPKSVIIGPYDVAIIYKDKIVVDDEEQDGCYDQAKQVLEIRKGCSNQRKQVVFVHEVIHALIHTYKVPVKKGEEMFIESLDYAVVAFFKNNKFNGGI